MDEAEVRPYFSFPHVLRFLMELSADLFGVEFRVETDDGTWRGGWGEREGGLACRTGLSKV